MKSKQAFTLIELLVVVLIIGILAAVALPQYQKAVERSKAAQALTLFKSVAQAAEAYHLANGTEFTSFDELSLDIPWTGNTQVVGQAQESKSNTEWSLEIEQSSTVNATTLFITRLDGKYQGAGFAMTLNDPDGIHHSEMSILCFERKTAATRTFDTSLAAGAYCAQIMKGSPRADNPETQYARYYTLP